MSPDKPAARFTAQEIGSMFSRLAPGYRRFNRWASLGQDDRWRRILLAEVSGKRRVLDVGTGTGELAHALSAAGAQAVGVDVSPAMLKEAGRGPGEYIEASAADLPFDDASFDAVVSAYVLRNLHQAGILEASLAAMARVLKPGGRLAILDLTRPRNPVWRLGHALYNATVLPVIGWLSFGNAWPGEYLARSIRALPPEPELKILFERCGFKDVGIRPLSGGIVSLFTGSI